MRRNSSPSVGSHQAASLHQAIFPVVGVVLLLSVMDLATALATDWVSFVYGSTLFISVSDGGWTWSLAIFEFKIILATLIRSLEFNETTARVHRKILQTMQPVTDGKGALLPVSLSLAQTH